MSAQKELTKFPTNLPLHHVLETFRTLAACHRAQFQSEGPRLRELFKKVTTNQRATVNRKSTHISEVLGDEEQVSAC